MTSYTTCWDTISNRTEFLLGITWWDQVYVAFEGDTRPDPHTYKPIHRTFRLLTDAGWSSDLPANLEGLSLLEARHDPILPRFSGGVGIPQRGMTEGALPSPPKTS